MDGSKQAPQWLIGWATLVCDHIGVGYGEFCSTARMPKIVLAREVFALLARTHPGPGGVFASFPDIVMATGRPAKAHSSAITAYARAKADPEAIELVRAIVEKMEADRKVPVQPLAVADITGLLEWVLGAEPSRDQITARARATLARIKASQAA